MRAAFSVCLAVNRYRGSTRPSSRRGSPSFSTRFLSQLERVCEQLCFYLSLLCSSICRMCLTVSLLYTILVYGNVSQKHPTSRPGRGGEKFAYDSFALKCNRSKKKKKCNCSLANTYGWGAETLQIRHHIPDHNDTPVVEWEALLKMVRTMHSEVWLFAAHGLACQVPLPMEFSRREYWSGVPFPTPRDLPDPGISRISRQRLYLQHHLVTPWGSAAAAKSLQPCPTLWDPIEGSPPGSPILACPFKDHIHPMSEKT